jgi:hypothetical protein
MQWQQAYARTGLGLCLKLQQKFTEAESLLIQAEQLTPTDLPRDRRQRRQLLADFYDQWNKADPGKGYDAESAKWRTKIDETPATTPSTTRDG